MKQFTAPDNPNRAATLNIAEDASENISWTKVTVGIFVLRLVRRVREDRELLADAGDIIFCYRPRLSNRPILAPFGSSASQEGRT
mmetsp:Transcript_10360/g.21967  ORF Transcript_10360/g.21967 Transcript_10360/m.21967 type:complete len:85 (-) Transcript_10360:14-268(-)